MANGQLTEAHLLAMLERRYRGETSGNGPAWAFVPHVRNAAGFAASRTVDAIAMSLWPSRGLELHGFEIKCSRSDWLRELKKPDKAEMFIAICDRWWIVAADKEIVRDGELPQGWGLLVARGGKLFQTVAAEVLPPIGEAPFNATGRSFLAALLRSAARTHDVTPEEVQQAVARALDRHRDGQTAERERLEESISILRARLDGFKETFGVALGNADDPTWYHSKPAAEVGAALRLVLDGKADIETYERRMRTMLDQAERLADDLRRSLGQAA